MSQECSDDTNEFDELILQDARYDGDSMGGPWLLFNDRTGNVEIADDYETSNDEFAREVLLSKEDATKLAARLLFYVISGKANEN